MTAQRKPKAEPESDGRPIRVDDEVYRLLLAKKHEMETLLGRYVPLGAAVRLIVEDAAAADATR